MKKVVFLVAMFLMGIGVGFSQTIWTGPDIVFFKEGLSDWTKPENQDCITNNVCLTRQNRQGLFNIIHENSDIGGPKSGLEPSDTEWAFGTTDNYADLNYKVLGALTKDHSFIFNEGPMVLHLISEDIYIDIEFLDWATGNEEGQGLFMYRRSTPTIDLANEKFPATQQLVLFPNPTSDRIAVLGVYEQFSYAIYNSLGIEITNGISTKNGYLSIADLPSGLYFLKLDTGNTFQFCKVD